MYWARFTCNWSGGSLGKSGGGLVRRTTPATSRLVVNILYNPRCSLNTIQERKTVTTGVVIRMGATILGGRVLMARYRASRRNPVSRPVR